MRTRVLLAGLLVTFLPLSALAEEDPCAPARLGELLLGLFPPANE